MNFFSGKKSPDVIAEQVKTSLTEPFTPEFSDYVQKIRRNCVAISCLVLLVTFGGISVSPDLSTSGFKLSGIDDQLVKTLLFILTTYWLVHFFWCALDYFYEWRLRLTRQIDDPYVWDASEGTATPARGSTFLRWIYFKHEPAIKLSQSLGQMKALLATADLSDNEKKRLTTNLDSAATTIQNLAHMDERIVQVFDQRMTRFENWWSFMRTSQSLRWFIIELCAPLVLGAIAVYKLAPDVMGPWLNAVFALLPC